MSKVISQVFIETDLRAYEGFFNHDWAKAVSDSLTARSQLADEFDKLGLAWKSISNAFRFPWLIVVFHQQFADGFLDVDEPFTVRFTQELKKRIVERGREHGPSPLLADVIGDVDLVKTQLTMNRKKLIDNQIATKAWTRYLKESEFQLAIIGLMQQTYTGLFFAYEHFLLQCYRTLTGDLKTRTNPPAFSQKLIEVLGSAVATQCWNGEAMKMRRQVRNALAHNGGKYNSGLDRWRSDLHVIGDELQITASENRLLYSALQHNVDSLIEAALERFNPPN